MPHRVVTDAAGTSWQVWDVSPDGLSGRPTVVAVAPMYARGWLAFEQLATRNGATPEKRRLAPVPGGWAAAPEHELLALLASALPVTPRPRTRPGA